MGLFTDGPPSSIEDLSKQDSGLSDVCRVEQIDASVKLILAQEELAVAITSLFEQQCSLYPPSAASSHLKLRNVAVTLSLKMWHTWHTLALIYRDAYFNQLNDRFQAKWTEYERLGGDARNNLRDLGVGLVLDPLQKPEGPTLSTSPATELGGVYYFAVTLLNRTGEESSPSTVETSALPAGNAVIVQIAPAAENVCGWNVYAGTDPKALHLQNSSPISTDETWMFYPSTAATSGKQPGSGQNANYLRVLPRVLRRG